MEKPQVAFAPVVTLMAIAKIVVTADFSAVSVAMPSIGRDLGVAPALLSWVVVANALALAGLLMVGGRLVDRLGHRTVLVAGLALFGAGAVAAGLAPTIYWLFAARALQGAAVALISPSAFALIPAFVAEGPPRHRALGVFGMTQGLSLILGLLLGGGLVTAFGWRAVFVVNLPLLAVAAVLALKILPRHVAPARQPVDYGGAMAWALAMVALVSGISALGRVGLAAPLTLGLLGAAALMLAAFAGIERRVVAPLVSAAMLRRPGVAAAAGLTMVFMAGVGGLMLLTQLYVQRVLGFSAALAGLATMPYAAAVIGAGHFAPRLLARFSARELVAGAAVLNLAGFLWLAATAGGPYAMSVAPGMVICALGSVTAFIALMGAATGALAPVEQGAGTALLFTCQNVGVALGASVSLSLLDAHRADLAASDFPVAFLALAAALALALVAALFTIRRRPVATPQRG